jgi:hypothetical protein
VIDHLVLATPSVEATAEAIRTSWAVPIVAGGSHVGLGTRNALTGLGGATYLEIVGPDEGQPMPPFPRPFGVDGLTEAALVAWCVRPARPLADVLARISAEGIDLGPVTEMSRERPDGVTLRWQLTYPLLQEPHLGTLPFLIDWMDSPHPTTTVPYEAILQRLTITHPQPDFVAAVLGAIGTWRTVAVEPGPPGLNASISTPRGIFTLSR